MHPLKIFFTYKEFPRGMRRLDTDSQRLTKVSASQDFSQRHGSFGLGLGFSFGGFFGFYFFPWIAIGFIRQVLTASVGGIFPVGRSPPCVWRVGYQSVIIAVTTTTTVIPARTVCVPSDLSAGATISPLQMRHRGPEGSRTCPDLTDCTSGRGGLQTPVYLAQKHMFIPPGSTVSAGGFALWPLS